LKLQNNAQKQQQGSRKHYLQVTVTRTRTSKRNKVMYGSIIWSAVFLLFSCAHADYYDDMYIQDLYKRLTDLEYGVPSDYDDIAMDLRDMGQAEIRDQEYQGGQMPGGFQYISGGAGEGSQHLTPAGTQNNTQEVKSDETLPFYCHPPNPCPKGFTESDGCQSDILDTAESQKEWIQGMMNDGKCSCDDEHMFECPKTDDVINTIKGHASRDDMDKMLDSLINNPDAPNPYVIGNKRNYIVAKKSPGMSKRWSM